MANPSGQNSPVNFNGFVQNPPVYGDKQRQGDLARTSPVAGAAAAAPALNSARRAKSRATKQQQPVQQPPVPVQAPPVTAQEPSYAAQLAQAWAEVAAVPGASPLVQQLAQEAQS